MSITQNKHILKTALSITLLFVMLCGCADGIISSLSESEMPEEISVNKDVAEVSADKIPTQQELLSRLTKRAEELTEYIPIEYLETVAQHTQITNPDSFNIEGWRTSFEEYLNQFVLESLGIFVKESENYYVLLLRCPTQTYWERQYHEYHVFQNGEYLGYISHKYPTYEDELKILEYGGHAWMVERYYDGGGPGSGYGQKGERWFDLRHPSAKAALQFTSDSWAHIPTDDRSQEITYSAEVADIRSSDVGGISIDLKWKEDITYDDELIIHGEGEVTYDNIKYSQVNDYFSPHFTMGYNNSAFGEATYSRLNEKILFLYIDQIMDIAENGNDKQKEWLRWFLSTIDELDKFEQMNRWYGNETLSAD